MENLNVGEKPALMRPCALQFPHGWAYRNCRLNLLFSQNWGSNCKALNISGILLYNQSIEGGNVCAV